ncbi:MAG: YbaK/EbsC family protein [Anaerolineales bacterium]|nr:YbaK/EbsC family protein [Anaerolineales bacterium]
MTKMTAVDLQQYLHEQQIAAQIIHLPSTTLTVPEAADVLGVSPDQIIKSVLFLAEGEPLLVISCGVARIAWKQLADWLGISRRRLKTGTADQVLAITGYVVGSVPPFGHRHPLRTVVETAVLDQPIIYGGGGDVNALLRLTPGELQRVVGEETAVLAERES